MLAFAKDITHSDPSHPEESKHPKLKEYMDYQRKLNHDMIIYHSLDHAKTFLQTNIDECGGDAGKLQTCLEQAFPHAHRFAKADTLLLMLRKLINAQNSTNNWYRLNDYYFALVYDCIERFIKIHNRMIREDPGKAREYNLSGGVEVDFDDWVQMYFHNLDFLVGREIAYPHFLFRKRNQTIERSLEAEIKGGKTREEALKHIQDEFEIDAVTLAVLLDQPISTKNLELLYTSASNPIYEFLYEPNSEMGLMDEESVIDHSYFLGHQLQGLSEEEAEEMLTQIMRMAK